MIDYTCVAPFVFDFLKELKKNNNRDWFQENKERYTSAHEHMAGFAEDLWNRVSTHDVLEPASGKRILFRIYRDTRFSKDKTPYKENFGGSLVRASAQRRGGYYFHIEPGNSFLAGGFWKPEKEDLARIRKDLAAEPERLRQIISNPSFVKTFGILQGEQVKSAPKGYQKDHPAIDLLKYKQFYIMQTFKDKEVQKTGFSEKISLSFKKMRPFFDYMTEVLTTDENGVSLFEND